MTDYINPRQSGTRSVFRGRVTQTNGTSGWRRVLGVGALVFGGLTVALWLVAMAFVIAPLLVWLGWNVLKFGPAIGLPRLGFWPIIALAVFLAVGWFGKSLITAIVFLVDPSWLHRSASMHWPAPTFRNFIAVSLLAIVASRPHARQRKTE
jgi:hypothetical protein